MLPFTNEPLFVDPTPYVGTKVAAVTLNRDGGEWEEQIIKSLHEEHPYIAERDVQIHITKEDAENGVGVGSIHVDGKLAIPLIIDKFKLAPLDIVWEDGKLRPLTRTTFERKLLSTAAGKPIAPGQGEMTDVSMYSRAQPPFDGKYTYAGFAGPGEGATLEAAFATLSENDLQLVPHQSTLRPVLADYCNAVAMDKTASEPDGYTLEPLTDDAPFRKIASAGPYAVVTSAGLVSAALFDHVFRADGTLMPKLGFLVALDGSGRSAMLTPEKEVFGRPLVTDEKVGVSEPRCGEEGVFFKVADGIAACSRPMTLGFRVGDAFSAESDGRAFRVVKSASFRTPIFSDGALHVPADWYWMKTGRALRLADATAVKVATEGVVKIARRGDVFSVQIGNDSMKASEHAVTEMLTEKLGAAAAKTAIAAVNSSPSAMFKVVKPKAVHAFRTARTIPTKIAARNLLKEAMYITSLPALSLTFGTQQIKLAAVTDDAAKKTVDALLGLNFLNAETVHRFVDQIDMLEQAAEVVAKLLLASRLGLDVDSRPLRTAMFALDSVCRDLKELRNAAEVEEQEN